MKFARILLSLASLALVLGIAWWELHTTRESPGPVHPAHAAVAELRGGTNCDACHERGSGVAADRCIACHAPIGAQQRSRNGVHGSLPAPQLARCETCHPEHHGAAAALVTPLAFARVGIADPKHYDHAHVRGFALTGGHQGLACERCHQAAAAASPPHGGRFLGLSQTCTTCHDDVHRGVYGADCDRCHGQTGKFRDAPGFRHESLPLRDGHARVSCAQCHPAGTPHDIAALQTQPQPTRTCAACHADPHHDLRTGPATAIRLLADTADCSRCHQATRWPDARLTSEAHARTGFPLRGAHAAVACAVCHGDGTHPGRYDGPAPAVASCAQCHRHPHRATLIAAATAATGPADGCAGCHTDTQAKFTAGTMTAAQHAWTGVALTEPHARVDCAKCHQGGTWPQRFPGRRGDDCRACHQDVHRGQFAHEPRYAQCTSCHVPHTFRPHAFDLAAHQQTRFPLTGSHQAVACPLCHKQELAPGTRAFQVASTECAACHQDVHQGRFDAPGRPVEVQGRSGCLRCHDTHAFAPVAAFDHRVWTGYALEGAHAKLECIACHAPQPGRGERRLGPAAGRNCADCHREPHAGQFAQGAATDCTRCHGSDRWQPTHFDHQKDSRFPLDAQHVHLECAKCHKSYPTSQGPVVRYKPLGTTCGDCHQLGARKERK